MDKATADAMRQLQDAKSELADAKAAEKANLAKTGAEARKVGGPGDPAWQKVHEASWPFLAANRAKQAALTKKIFELSRKVNEGVKAASKEKGDLQELIQTGLEKIDALKRSLQERGSPALQIQLQKVGAEVAAAKKKLSQLG